MDHYTDHCFSPEGYNSTKGWSNEPQLRRTKTTLGFCGCLPVLWERGRMDQEAGKPAWSWDGETPDGDGLVKRWPGGTEIWIHESQEALPGSQWVPGEHQGTRSSCKSCPLSPQGLTWALCSDLPALPHFPLCGWVELLKSPRCGMFFQWVSQEGAQARAVLSWLWAESFIMNVGYKGWGNMAIGQGSWVSIQQKRTNSRHFAWNARVILRFGAQRAERWVKNLGKMNLGQLQGIPAAGLEVQQRDLMVGNLSNRAKPLETIKQSLYIRLSIWFL